MLSGISDTIVAPATPPGHGALGIVRLSGKDAVRIADQIFRGKKLGEQHSHTLHFGRIVDGSEAAPLEISPERTDRTTYVTSEPAHEPTIDEVVVSLFLAPRSFTGEDVVEISCHGSPYILQRVAERCVECGARPAQPGEFTQRAFLNGKLDLTQAEAVHDAIASESAAAHRAAMHQLRGGFSKDLRRMREELIHFAALIELELDFSEEDVEFADRTQLQNLLRRVSESTGQLINSFRLGNAAKNGVRVAIIGPPNAGKSTLLNALLNEERAIVSDVAGTTRDTVEEVMNIDGILFRFIDTAGIREHTNDVIEQQGIARSKKAAAGADVVLHVIDFSHENADDGAMELWRRLKTSQDARPFLLILSKWDLQEDSDATNLESPAEWVPVSAKTGRGISDLKRRLAGMIGAGGTQPGDTIITNTRHLAALKEIHAEIAALQSGLASGVTGDLLSHHIRAALFQIGLLTGHVEHDRDVLGAVFSKFCIGK